jgi:GNAT superfamily N-acetyltransferase
VTERLLVRDARPADLEGLAAVCYGDQPAIHADRLRAAALGHLRFLVAELDGDIVGFGLLVFSRPETWPGAGTSDGLPAILDLHVAESMRGRGIGTAMIQRMEEITASNGCTSLFLSVDPVENARAHALYARLGYRALQAEPYLDRWRFVDSEGMVHEGEDWQIELVKSL